MENKELFEKIVERQKTYGKIDDDFVKDKLEEFFPGKFKKIFYLKGEVIAKEGDLPDQLFFIDRGKVMLTKQDVCGREYSNGYLMSGEFFEFSSNLDLPNVVNYKAISNCSIYNIDIKAVQDGINNNKEISDFFMKILIYSSRLLTVRQGYLIMGGCRESFVSFIVEHFHHFGRVDDNGFVTVTLDVNLTDIAVMLNMTRETLSRIVSEMKKEGIIETKRRFIRIKNLEKFIG